MDRHVAEHDKLSPAAIADSSGSALAVASELRERLTHQLGDFTAAYKRRIEESLNEIDQNSLSAQPVADPLQWLATQLHEPMRESVADARAVLSGLPLDNVPLAVYLMEYGQALDRRPLLPMMRRALLVTAVASAETTLIGILRRIQYDRDGVDRWGPMWDSPALDKEIRKLTRGSIEDWGPRVLADLDVDLPAASCDWDAVREVWARRHVLVHNAGLADKKYTERIGSDAEGTLLEVNDEYLRTAVDLLCGFVLGVMLTHWSTLPDRFAFVVQLADMYATIAEPERRWPLAENMHMVAAHVAEDKVSEATSMVNAWLARARWRGPDSVRSDVDHWTTDGLPARFPLARTILLGERDMAIAMIPQLLERGEITVGNLRDWPLFASLRDMPGFQRLVAA